MPSCLPPPSPVWSTASALEELAFEHVGFPAESVRYLNMLRSDRDSFMGSGLEVPVTTGLVLISGAASGNNLANIVQAIDSNKWPDEKRLILVIKRTLEVVKTPAEYARLVRSKNSADVAACMRRELKDPYVPMPKFKIGRAKKKVNADSAEVAGTGGAFVAVPGAAAAAGEERPLLGAVAGAAAAAGEECPLLDSPVGYVSQGGSSAAAGSGGASSSGVARGAAEFHFKVGDSVLVCGKPYMPFIDTQSFCGIVTGFSATCGARG